MSVRIKTSKIPCTLLQPHEVIKAISTITKGTFMYERSRSTLLGGTTMYDRRGNIISPDPNTHTYTLCIEDIFYKVVVYHWNVKVYKEEFNITNDINDIHRPYKFSDSPYAECDITPDYVKNHKYIDTVDCESFVDGYGTYNTNNGTFEDKDGKIKFSDIERI